MYTRRSQFSSISEEDKKIISGIINEKNNYEIADEVGYSIGGIKRRLEKLFKMFGVRGRVGLIREFFKYHLSSGMHFQY